MGRIIPEGVLKELKFPDENPPAPLGANPPVPPDEKPPVPPVEKPPVAALLMMLLVQDVHVEDELAPLAIVTEPEPAIAPESVPVPLGGVTIVAPPPATTNELAEFPPLGTESLPPSKTVPLAKLLADTVVPDEPGGGAGGPESPPELVAAIKLNESLYQ